MNGCGDPVRFTPTGRKLLNATGTLMAVEVMRVDVLAHNDCFAVPPPVPAYAHNRKGCYTVNIVHIPPLLAEAYSTGRRYTEAEIEGLIRTSTSLFSCYLLA
ncbi:hypothetical protein ACFST9_13585 [Hymenobacter monticola]|uniref:Uncharacterized protein n=2 Tax=Hymenobacter TaxID=89966 RepID=A0ABY4BF34_9BACT|nr:MULTISPECIES: hypothetical protein [Hymenobacter]MDU0372335.1 hypothetical protein [Hymenobacter endophyticus]UOE36611.1 hypothetical protein MTP16_24280 [Hymenobacter monticola]